jgi:hypothetical protein
MVRHLLGVVAGQELRIAGTITMVSKMNYRTPLLWYESIYLKPDQRRDGHIHELQHSQHRWLRFVEMEGFSICSMA